MTSTETKNLIHDLQLRLDKVANKKTRDWWERYIKHDTIFRGVGIPKIREELKQWRAKERIDTLSLNDQLDLALSFFAEKYAEDKLAGVLFLQYYLYNKFDWKLLISRFEEIFRNKYIYDWNVCDWFCVRVLGAMIKENGVPCAKAISKWNNSQNLWQARASVVAFANYTKHSEYKLLMLGSCSKLIRRKERFAKTAVGWILRELSKTDKKAVMAFIEKHARYFSKESLENGIKKLSLSEKEKLRKQVYGK